MIPHPRVTRIVPSAPNPEGRLLDTQAIVNFCSPGRRGTGIFRRRFRTVPIIQHGKQLALEAEPG